MGGFVFTDEIHFQLKDCSKVTVNVPGIPAYSGGLTYVLHHVDTGTPFVYSIATQFTFSLNIDCPLTSVSVVSVSGGATSDWTLADVGESKPTL